MQKVTATLIILIQLLYYIIARCNLFYNQKHLTKNALNFYDIVKFDKK